MIGNTQKYTLSVEQIPGDCRVVHLQLPVNVCDLGTWCVPARVINRDSQAVWTTLPVKASPELNTD